MESLIKLWTENEAILGPLVLLLFGAVFTYQTIESFIEARARKRVDKQIYALRWNAERLGFVSDQSRSFASTDLSMHKPFGERGTLWLSCTPGAMFDVRIYLLSPSLGLDTMAGHVRVEDSSSNAIRSAVRQLLEDFIYAGKLPRDEVPKEMLRTSAAD